MTELLTDEQIKGIQDAIIKLFEPIREMWDKLKKLIIDAWERINKILVNQEPKKRYKLLKRLRVEDYKVFFKRVSIHRCRNNC